jgi:hypothetical protein
MTAFDRKELLPFFQGLVIGVLIMAVLVGISMALGQYHSLWFGQPRQ